MGWIGVGWCGLRWIGMGCMCRMGENGKGWEEIEGGGIGWGVGSHCQVPSLLSSVPFICHTDVRWPTLPSTKFGFQ